MSIGSRISRAATLIVPLTLFLLLELACRDAGTADEPSRGSAVLAVFSGCVPLSTDRSPGPCPAGTRIRCRADVHSCRRSDGTEHGWWLRLFPGGGRSLLLHHREGRRHGRWIQWYPDGRPMKSGEYRHGLKHGVWEGWHADGQPFYRHEYHRGRKSGRWIRFHPDGGSVVREMR